MHGPGVECNKGAEFRSQKEVGRGCLTASGTSDKSGARYI